MSRHFVVHHVEMIPASVLCTNVKWCSLCISWGDHFRTGHIDTDNLSVDDAVDEVPTEGNVTERNVSDKNGAGAAVGTFAGSLGGNVATEEHGGAVSRLRNVGLI